MGILSPDQHLPTSFPQFKEAVAAGTVVLAFNALCPVHHNRNEEGPHIEAADGMPSPGQPFAFGSTGATPLGWGDNSMEASNSVIRHCRALRDAQTRLAGTTSTDSSWLLLRG